jgi:hypothetical protein
MLAAALQKLKSGQLVRVRTRRWLVVEEPSPSSYGTWVRLACVDDDAQGDALEIIWEAELDAQVLDEEAWGKIGYKGFDDPRHFAAFFNSLRWHCVTSTDPKLFQAPFRSNPCERHFNSPELTFSSPTTLDSERRSKRV